jgi:hypothetical protein
MLRSPDQHHLQLQRDRLWLELDGRDHAEHLGHRLDADLVRQQRTLQRVPGEGLRQQLHGIDQQVAAVGAVQQPGLDVAEVGDQHAEMRHVIDAADQVLVRRQVGIDDGRAVAAAGIDQKIDLIAPQLLGLRGGGIAIAVLARAEGVGVVDDRGAHRLQVGGHLGQLGIACLGLVDGMVHRQLRGRTVQAAQPVGMLLAQSHRFAQHMHQLVLQLLHRLLQALPLCLRQRLELLR